MDFLSVSAQEALVAIVMGSKTDAVYMNPCREIFSTLEIPFSAQIISAHRTPDETRDFAKHAHLRGIEVIIAGAGASAALPGTVAAHTHLPVIGVPLNTSSLQGLDALLAIAQMPGGVPVACTAIGEAGAKNAALFAVRILAAKHEVIKQRLEQYMKNTYLKAKENIGVDPFGN
jgi:5-(carboxyamino)imidazole ribonucleotide mutase